MSIDRWDLSSLILTLGFISYMWILYTSGHFVDWPELIVEPFFILRGMNLYTNIGTHHTPLLTEFLAVLYRVAGTEVIVRKLLLLFISGLTALLIYRAMRYLAGKREAFYALLLFTVLWPFYGGLEFWFDTFLPLFYLIAFVILIRRHSTAWLAVAGASIGVSFLIKQNGALVAALILVMLYFRRKSIQFWIRECLIFSAGVCVPIAIIALWYGLRGQLDDAFYWIVSYNFAGYYPKIALKPPSLGEGLRLLAILAPVIFLFIGTIFSKTRRQMISWEFRLAFYTGFCASFAILPRWQRFHVAPALPFLVIILVLSIEILLSTPNQMRRKSRFRLSRILLFLWISFIILDIGTFYPPLLVDELVPNFTRRWPLRSYQVPGWYDEDYRKYVHDLPRIGRYLKDHTDEDDRIFVWGWQGSRIYLESDRLPAGNFYYTLPWFTCLPRFKKDLSMSFRRDQPRFVIVAKQNHQYRGTPLLEEMGVELEDLGYVKMTELEEQFSEVEIWTISQL